jgi:GH35 family endo-1,4-beta-xylanase
LTLGVTVAQGGGKGNHEDAARTAAFGLAAARRATMLDAVKPRNAAVALALFLSVHAAAGDVMDGADERIERHRKGDAVVRVVDADGRPVPGARIEIRQTRHAFLFGCNIFLWSQPDEPALEKAYRQRFSELLNFATLPFYWWSYEAEPGRPQHEAREEVARWCREQGIATKGHPLAWNYRDPSWLRGDEGEVRRLQLARIEDCVGRFKGLVDRWDVVNEAVGYGREECRKRAPLLTRLFEEEGPLAATRACFERARQANPDAVLMINDYETGAAYERLIEQLTDESGRRLYDAIGIQSHMHGGAWPPARAWEVCERFARFRVPLHFTEVTILSGEQGWEDRSPWPSTPEGEARQAREVESLYTALFSHPAVEAITWWDFSDRGAWKRAPAGVLRADMSPKPAYDVLVRLVKDRWWTRHEGVADAAGCLAVRGFYGDYAVRVDAGRASGSGAFALRRGPGNEWTVEIGRK